MRAHTRRSFRWKSVALGGAAALLAGVILSPQDNVYALDPGSAVKTVTTVLPPAVAATQAAASAGVATAGTVAAAAGAAAAAGYFVGSAGVCLFTSLECMLPGWSQSPSSPPNGDQPASGGEFFRETRSLNDVNRNPNLGKLLFRIIPYTGTGGGVKMEWRYENGDPSVWNGAYYSIGNDQTDGYYSMGHTTVRNHGECYWDPIDPCRNPQYLTQQGILTADYIRAAQGVDIIGTFCGCMQNFEEFRWRILPTSVPEATPELDPERVGQGWRECATATLSDRVRVVGEVVRYRESQAGDERAPIMLPGCPSTHPVPVSYGFGTTDAPLTPGTAYPPTEPMPLDRGFSGGYPADAYPDCPTPGSCTVGRPAPGTPLKPLPVPGGVVAPMPEPSPGYAPCAWGPYAVPEAACSETNTPQPPRGTESPEVKQVADRVLRRVNWIQPSDAQIVAERCVALAAAAGLTDQPCLNQPIFVPGSDAGEAALHDGGVIGEVPAWFRLTYMSPADKKAGGLQRDWYNAATYSQECAPDRLARGVECDEYPFYSSVEGGPQAYAQAASTLKEIDVVHNRVEGQALRRMHYDDACNMATLGLTSGPGSGTQPFLVVPMAVPVNGVFIGPPSFHVCGGVPSGG